MFLKFRVLWRRIRHQKLQKDTSQEPLTQHRERTPAVKSQITGMTDAPQSPSPTSHSPAVSDRKTPSPTGDQYEDSPTSKETIGPSSAEESGPNASVHAVEDETSNVDSRATLSENRMTTTISNQEILKGSLGQLSFSVLVRLEENKLILVVSVIKCSNLPGKGILKLSADPYVKLQLLPDRQYKVKTRVMKKTRNPVYEEDFSFYGIKASQLQSIILHFVVLTFEPNSRDDIIGEIFFPLNSVDIMNHQENTNFTFQKYIQPRILKMPTPLATGQERGEILVSLCWHSALKRLTVLVMKARNLPKMDVTGLADPYVKIYLTYKNERIEKRKTRVKKRTLNPRFEQFFIFEKLDRDDGLRHISLEFLVMDWDQIARNEVIGRMEFGAKGKIESAKEHWLEICECPRLMTSHCWHKLYE